MPLVRISLIRGKPPAYIRAVADGVHLALAEAFDVPADDRFQLITQHAPDKLIYDPDYPGIHRTDDIVVINIVASSGRDTVKKQALFRAVADNLARNPGLRPEDVMIVLFPNARDDWSFGRGLNHVRRICRPPSAAPVHAGCWCCWALPMRAKRVGDAGT